MGRCTLFTDFIQFLLKLLWVLIYYQSYVPVYTEYVISQDPVEYRNPKWYSKVAHTQERKLWKELAKQDVKTIWRVILLAIYTYILFIDPQGIVNALGRKFNILHDADEIPMNS